MNVMNSLDDEDNSVSSLRNVDESEGRFDVSLSRKEKNEDDESERYSDSESEAFMGSSSKPMTMAPSKFALASNAVSKTGLMVLILLAVQNCSKNLLMRYVMKDRPKFLTSAAVLGSEFIKLSLSTCYILFLEKRPPQSILHFLHEDRRNTLLLTVPASAYNLQMSLEYVALANLNAAVFSVLVQTKLLFTATFAAMVLRKKLKYVQVISLVLLTTGVMLCNLSNAKDKSSETSELDEAHMFKGVTATLGIALSSGFASVYTEKVIKGYQAGGGKRPVHSDGSEYGLAYTQVQLSLMSLITIGIYACMMDFKQIVEYGLFHNFTISAFFSVLSSAVGGLIVAAVLKYADSVLKGYATAMSVILTGVLSMLLFETSLTTIYFMGIVNVVTAVLLYNGKDLDQFVCAGNA
jgi:solute carrier family 35 (UDP-sugar transporter), member A1/2/3